MFRGIQLSAAWLGCAAGLLLHVGSAHANARPTATSPALAPLAVPAASDVVRVLALPAAGIADGVGDGQARRVLDDFARALGRRLEWHVVERAGEATRLVGDGAVDVVVGAATSVLDERALNEALAATSPVATERYIVVGRTGNTARSPLDLREASVAMAVGSPHWPYFERLGKVLPALKLHALADTLAREAPLQLVADGMVDFAVVPVTSGPDPFVRQPRVRRLFDLTPERPLSWYVRRDDPALLANLNQFIDRYHAAYFEPAAAPRDFAAIKRRGVLRVITRVEPGNYFIRDGRPSGFELELAANFAEKHKLRLEVRVAHDDRQMVEWLAKGAGDLVTGRLVGAPGHGAPGFVRSRPYRYEAYATVSRRTLPLRSQQDLDGLVFAAAEDSPEYRALLSMRARQNGITVIPVSPEVSEATLLARVAEGMVDATVVPGHAAAGIRARHPELVVGASVAHEYDYRWTAREDDSALLDAVDEFLVDAERSGLTDILAARYDAERDARTLIATNGGRLSPYDPIVQHYADRYGFDWRLIAAQMYQESQFDPRAVSPSGARGLMQLMPSTALALGFADLARPESSIHAGVKYLYELRNEIDADVPVGERTWFALAAYNLGPKGLDKARRYAARLKLDPNRWSGNVEAAMLKLAGNAGGDGRRRYGQALIYVRTIQSLYGSYRSLQVSAAPGLSPVPRA